MPTKSYTPFWMDATGYLLMAVSAGTVAGMLASGLYLGPLGPVLVALSVLGMCAFAWQWRVSDAR